MEMCHLLLYTFRQAIATRQSADFGLCQASAPCFIRIVPYRGGQCKAARRRWTDLRKIIVTKFENTVDD
jgi:hypothetical protein